MMNQAPYEPTMENEMSEVSGSLHFINSMETRDNHEVIETARIGTKQEEINPFTFDEKTEEKELAEENEASVKFERMHTLYMAESFESKEVVVCVANNVPIEVSELGVVDEEKNLNAKCKSDEIDTISDRKSVV